MDRQPPAARRRTSPPTSASSPLPSSPRTRAVTNHGFRDGQATPRQSGAPEGHRGAGGPRGRGPRPLRLRQPAHPSPRGGEPELRGRVLGGLPRPAVLRRRGLRRDQLDHHLVVDARRRPRPDRRCRRGSADAIHQGPRDHQDRATAAEAPHDRAHEHSTAHDAPRHGPATTTTWSPRSRRRPARRTRSTSTDRPSSPVEAARRRARSSRQGSPHGWESDGWVWGVTRRSRETVTSAMSPPTTDSPAETSRASSTPLSSWPALPAVSRPTTAGSSATASRPARRAIGVVHPRSDAEVPVVGRRHDRGGERRDREGQAETEHDRTREHGAHVAGARRRRRSRGGGRPRRRAGRASWGAEGRCAGPARRRGRTGAASARSRARARTRPRGPSSPSTTWSSSTSRKNAPLSAA